MPSAHPHSDSLPFSVRARVRIYIIYLGTWVPGQREPRFSRGRPVKPKHSYPPLLPGHLGIFCLPRYILPHKSRNISWRNTWVPGQGASLAGRL
jgi:hypothetical protein